MGKLKILFISLLIFGCTKYSEMERNEYGNYFFKTDKIHLREVALIPWKVGITTKEIITRGIVFTLNFPRLKNNDIFTLHEKTKANSWLVRIRRTSALGSSILGHFYSPFLLPGIPGVEKLRAKPLKSMTLQVFYFAATLPDELVNSPCPPMNHRKVVTEVFVDPKSDAQPTMTITPDSSFTLEENIPEYSYQTPTINGGNDLAGVYHFEIAIFDSNTKKVIGDWVEYPETFTVVKESEILLDECINYTPPKIRPENNDFRRFKWKENMFKEEGE
jgi:hypothetical protein